MIIDGRLYGDRSQAWLTTTTAASPPTDSLPIFSHLPASFVDVVAGHDHWLALTKEGDLYSWGSNR